HTLEVFAVSSSTRPAHRISGLQNMRWYCRLASVHADQTVQHGLPRLRTRIGEAQAEDEVVQPQFQCPQQVLAGHAVPADRFLIVTVELVLEDAVDCPRPLLFA